MKGSIPMAMVSVLLLAVIPVPLTDAGSSDMVLVDFGNGQYQWYENKGGSTFIGVLENSVNDPDTVGDIRTSRFSDCGWHCYQWDGKWVDRGDRSQCRMLGDDSIRLLSRRFRSRIHSGSSDIMDHIGRFVVIIERFRFARSEGAQDARGMVQHIHHGFRRFGVGRRREHALSYDWGSLRSHRRR